MHHIQSCCKHLFIRLGSEHMAVPHGSSMHLEYKMPTSTTDAGTKHILSLYTLNLETTALPAVLLSAAPLCHFTAQGPWCRDTAKESWLQHRCHGQEPYLLDSFNRVSKSPVPSCGLKTPDVTPTTEAPATLSTGKKVSLMHSKSQDIG